MSKIVIIDYGMGNISSVKKKLMRLGVDCIVSSNSNDIKESEKIILPGVGHFGKAMQNLEKLGLIDVLTEEVLIKKKPILGICLGMQLMAKSSEEGHVSGLGWFDSEVIKIKVQNTLKYKIPHSGWNQISISKPSVLMKDVPELTEVYFVHSYHFKCNHSNDVLNETIYETKIVSAVEKENIFGVQYHPEKSHEFGELILINFINL